MCLRLCNSTKGKSLHLGYLPVHNELARYNGGQATIRWSVESLAPISFHETASPPPPADCLPSGNAEAEHKAFIAACN
ncbi:unnamed protein product [Natator depressus]